MSKSTVVDALHEAVKEVLQTFTGQAPSPENSFIRDEPEALGEVSAVVGLAGKSFTGSFAVSFQKECIFQIVASLFGHTPQEINEEVRDAAGEMANMMCGAFRRRFEQQGISLQASTPVVVTGKDHTLKFLCQSKRLVIPYSLNGARLFVEFCLDKK
jgi:chemotaxis protein CheX